MENNNPDTYKDNRPISLFEWMITMLILSVPLLNFIMLFVWAFGGERNETKVNFARAVLLWMLIGIVIMLLFMSTIVGTLREFGGLDTFNV